MVVVAERKELLDLCYTSSQSIKDCANVCARLHGDDSKLIFLVDPNEESFVCIVENATTIGPVPIQVASLKEAISFFEEVVVINELLSLLFGEGVQGIELAGEISSVIGERLNDFGHNFIPLFVRQAWPKWEASKVTANSDSSRDDHGGFIFWEGRAVELGCVHI